MAGDVFTREDHLAWAKARALAYVDRGELSDAVASMTSDLRKHSAWETSFAVATMSAAAILFEIPRGAEAVRRWIERWN